MVAINREAAAVYLLDDDPSILKATRRLLDSAGWNMSKSSPIRTHFWSTPRCIGPSWQ